MAKIRKTWYFVWSEKKIWANNLDVKNGDLLSIVNGFVVKSTVAATTATIAWIAVWDKKFAADNQTVAKDIIDFPVKNDEMRVEINTVTDLAQANVGGKYDINASQVVVLTAAGTQVELVEILGTRKGSFKLL